jgi:hypothetical protein
MPLLARKNGLFQRVSLSLTQLLPMGLCILAQVVTVFILLMRQKIENDIVDKLAMSLRLSVFRVPP